MKCVSFQNVQKASIFYKRKHTRNRLWRERGILQSIQLYYWTKYGFLVAIGFSLVSSSILAKIYLALMKDTKEYEAKQKETNNFLLQMYHSNLNEADK